MIIDPIEALKKTSAIVVPTSTPTGISPIPTVVPDLPEYQHAHHDGKTTLWVVFVIMVIASAVFAGMSWRVPVVSRAMQTLVRNSILTTRSPSVCTMSSRP